jgi:NAD(P)-dependent dehydrogenase (short-subunit alcohol dehydrogenase family)
VISTARDPYTLNSLVAAYPDSCFALPLDVRDPAAIHSTVATAHSLWGRLDVIVNNAGYGLLGSLEDVSEAQIENLFAINFLGPIRVVRAALPFLRAQRSGFVVNMGAIAGLSNEPGFSIYGGAKFALHGATESLRTELAPLGIQVTVVVPGPFRTDFIARSLDRSPVSPDYEGTVGKFGRILNSINGKQIGDPARAAEAIVAQVESGTLPPLFPLGKYAVEKMKKKSEFLAKEALQWETTAIGTDFPPAPRTA